MCWQMSVKEIQAQKCLTSACLFSGIPFHTLPFALVPSLYRKQQQEDTGRMLFCLGSEDTSVSPTHQQNPWHFTYWPILTEHKDELSV